MSGKLEDLTGECDSVVFRLYRSPIDSKYSVIVELHDDSETRTACAMATERRPLRYAIDELTKAAERLELSVNRGKILVKE